MTNEPPVRLPPHRGIEHHILLMEGPKPTWRHQYRLSYEETKELERQVTDLMNKGFLFFSASPYNALVSLVRKEGWNIKIVR